MAAQQQTQQETRHKKTSNKVQTVNRFWMTVLYWGVRFWIFLSGVRIRTVNKVGKLRKPAIVLCNHGSFIDFIYAAALLRKCKPHFIVARLYFYNSALRWLLRKVGDDAGSAAFHHRPI